MAKLATTYKNPHRRFRKFNKKKVKKLLTQAPKFFAFQGSVRYEFGGEVKVLELGIPFTLGKYGKFTLVAFDGISATIKHRAHRQKNDRSISVRNNKTVSIGRGMFLKQPS